MQNGRRRPLAAGWLAGGGARLARRLGVSPYYLSRQFRVHAGLKLNAYLRLVRVYAARYLLDHTDMKVEAVAAAVGFHDASHMSDAFHEVTGLDSTTDIIEHREGGNNTTPLKLAGQTKHANIVLRWGMTIDNQLFEWHKSIVDGNVDRRNGSVVLLDRRGTEVARWNFVRAWPTKYTAPSLSAEASDVAIESVDAPLTLTDAGSRDRDYNAEFTVVGVRQPLAVYNVPLDRVENAAADVTIVSTVEYANTGTTHSDGRRVAYTPATRACVIAGVGGDLSAWFSRANLHVSGVQGKIDVRNEAGDTVIDAQTLPPMPHHVAEAAVTRVS